MADICELLRKMHEYNASDLYISEGFPPTWRDDEVVAQGDSPLSSEEIEEMILQLVREDEYNNFRMVKELNSAFEKDGIGRFRVNFFVQQQKSGFVIRRVMDRIPTIEELDLPPIYKEMIGEKHGLVLMAGTSGSGKSTSIAAMLNHRNKTGQGHIITVEDPIEYVHGHIGCMITQREIGIDSLTWDSALKNALRQRPDIIYIGEIRDKDVMKHALNFAETGHLCIATLHATTASQAVERVANFFPASEKEQNLYSLSQVLKYIVGQRLVPGTDGKRVMCNEIMKNVGLIRPLIKHGDIIGIKDIMNKNEDIGMGTFDQNLVRLFDEGKIAKETALEYADSPDNMSLELMKNKVVSSTSSWSSDSDF